MANPLDTFTHDTLIGGDFDILTKQVTVLSGEPASLARGALMGVAKTGSVTETHAGNTGTGSIGTITKGILAKAGVYTLEIIRAVSNAGDFVITDPEGNLVGFGHV